jgi:hypothetical protein
MDFPSDEHYYLVNIRETVGNDPMIQYPEQQGDSLYERESRQTRHTAYL